MLTRLPTATIRTEVELSLRFADGYFTDARVFSFDGLVDGREHLAFALGDRTALCSADGRHVSLIRPHSECLSGDVFGSQRCDCGPQRREAVERIAEAGGYVLYLRQEGRETKARRGRHTLELPSALRSRSSDSRLVGPGEIGRVLEG